MSETIYVVISLAVQKDGPQVFGITEKAFRDNAQAQNYCKSKGPAIWNETLNDLECTCERAIHIITLE
jgi:hypothetical protein